MTMPNFLIIGAMKAGTTSIYSYIKQHPQIYMSHLKEPHFFSSNEYQKRGFKPISSIEEYRALFNDVSCEKAIGEASTTYLANPKAAERISYCIPEAKLIAIFRDPASRAYSHYLMSNQPKLAKEHQNTFFDDFFRTLQSNSHIFQSGLYFIHLKHYLSLFGSQQIKVFLYEDLKNNLDNLLLEIFQFLGVDDSFTPKRTESRYNLGGIPSNKFVYDVLEISRQSFNKFISPFMPKVLVDQLYQAYAGVRTKNLNAPPPLPLKIREQIIAMYREDILQLQDLIQRDLTLWLK